MSQTSERAPFGSTPNRRILIIGLALVAISVISVLAFVLVNRQVSTSTPNDRDRAVAAYRDVIEETRHQEWTTELQLQILDDYWISDEELAEIERVYSECVAENFPGSTVEFVSPNQSRIIFANDTQEELNTQTRPCSGLMGLIRPLHDNMRTDPDFTQR